MSTKIIDINAYAIRKLHKYDVTIKYDYTVKENRGYVFTPSSIDGHPKKCVRFQQSIDLMVMALEHNPSLIRQFLKSKYKYDIRLYYFIVFMYLTVQYLPFQNYLFNFNHLNFYPNSKSSH